MPSQRRTLPAVTALLAALGCTFDQQIVSAPAAQAVVHAVIDASLTEQRVLVERSLEGTIDVKTNLRFDPNDPIVSAGGIPIAGAVVTITGPDGRAHTGAEQPRTGSTLGSGLYRVQTGAIVPGGRYTLRIRTPGGIVVTGSTVVPSAKPVTPPAALLPFDRDRDTLRLAWPAVAGARSYGLFVDTPFAPFQLFADSTRFQLAGDLRNLFAPSLQRVFIPGFRQAVTVYAVDTNYFDYYRSRNDPFTGSGLINRLEGGVGLFGSIVIVQGRTVDVTQGPREPAIEGDYEISRAPFSPPPIVDVFKLYVESPGEPAALSGWYMRNRILDVREGVDGARRAGKITLDFLVNQNALDTIAVFTGVQVGDSLVGSYVGVAGRVVFKRRR